MRFSISVLEHITTFLRKRGQFSKSRIYSVARMVSLSEALVRVRRLSIDAVHVIGWCLLRASARVFCQIEIATVIFVLLRLLLSLLGLEWISTDASCCSTVGIRLCLGEVKLDVTRSHYVISVGKFISLVCIESADWGRVAETDSVGSRCGGRRCHWWSHKSNSRG